MTSRAVPVAKGRGFSVGLILKADIVSVVGKKYCTLWLDGCPSGLRLVDSCRIGGIEFEQVPVHFNFHDAKRQMETCFIAVKMEGVDLPESWFAGKRVVSSSWDPSKKEEGC